MHNRRNRQVKMRQLFFYSSLSLFSSVISALDNLNHLNLTKRQLIMLTLNICNYYFAVPNKI